MTLQEIKEAIAQLSPSEFDALQAYMKEQERSEWAARFDAAVKGLQEGLTREQVNTIKKILSDDADYIEEVDLSIWQD